MIEEYIKTKRIRRCEQERKGIPDELIDLMSIPGLGPKTPAALHKKHHSTSFEDLNIPEDELLRNKQELKADGGRCRCRSEKHLHRPPSAFKIGRAHV